MTRNLAALGGALLALVVGGCGGGGGGASIPLPPPGPAATGTINNGSVLAVSGRSAAAAFQSSRFGIITDVVGLTTVGTSGPGIVSKPGGWQAWSQIPVGPETTACIVDGTVTVSGDIASPLTVTAGDFLDYAWEDCDDGLGQVLNGQIGMTFTEFEGNLLAGRILLDVSLLVQGFRVAEGVDTSVTTGDLNLTIDSRTQPETIVTTLGNSLMINNGTSTETLTGFSSTVTEDTSVFPSNFTTELSGRVSSSQFNGVVSYNTPVPFESSGDGFPYEGEMFVFGDSGANVQIIAMDDANVRIEADYNGDGASDATIDTTWAALVGN